MRSMDRLKSILVLMIMVMIVLVVMYRQELGAWMADQLMGESTSQLQELLR